MPDRLLLLLDHEELLDDIGPVVAAPADENDNVILNFIGRGQGDGMRTEDFLRAGE